MTDGMVQGHAQHKNIGCKRNQNDADRRSKNKREVDLTLPARLDATYV